LIGKLVSWSAFPKELLKLSYGSPEEFKPSNVATHNVGGPLGYVLLINTSLSAHLLLLGKKEDWLKSSAKGKAKTCRFDEYSRV
jgi:hypothetical protein